MNGIRFTVVSSGESGVREHQCHSIDELCSHLYNYYDGWDSRDSRNEFLAALRTWACYAKPGDIFKLRYLIVVTQPLDTTGDECPRCMSESIEYEDISPVEDGHLEQKCHCTSCNAQWIDEFAHSARRYLCDFIPKGD